MLFDIRTVLRKKIIFVPVIQHALFYRLHVLVSVIAPDYKIAEISGFHTRLIDPVRIRNDIQFYIEFFQHDLTEPSDLLSGIVCQLVKHVQGHCLLGNDFRQ